MSSRVLTAGVDEVGRGPLAGPVVVAAVILGRPIDGLADSKQLSAAERLRLSLLIREHGTVAMAAASVLEIERLNILGATLLAMRRAVGRLGVRPALVLVDGNRPPVLDLPVRCIVGGSASRARDQRRLDRGQGGARPPDGAAGPTPPGLRLGAQCRLRHGRASGGPGAIGAEPPSPPRLRALRTAGAAAGGGRGWLTRPAQRRPSIAAQKASRARKLSALSLGERISSRKAQPGQAGSRWSKPR